MPKRALAGDLFAQVEPRHCLPDDLEVLGILERHLLRDRELRRGLREPAVPRPPVGASWITSPFAVRHSPSGTPTPRRPRSPAWPALARPLPAAASTPRGQCVLPPVPWIPNSGLKNASAAGPCSTSHLRPVDVELLGHQHGDRGQHALAHLGVAAHHGDRAIGADPDERVRRERRGDRFGGASGSFGAQPICAATTRPAPTTPPARRKSRRVTLTRDSRLATHWAPPAAR